MEIKIAGNILRALFQNVYFVNGTAYAGKSTLVRMLAEKYGGVLCGENYHDELIDAIDGAHQPNLSYLRATRDWQAFVSRTPEAYAAWVAGCSEEASGLEIALLLRRTASGKKVFVDTNLSPAVLAEISDYHRVLFLLAPQETSVNRFFEREDREKQFLYRVLRQCPDPARAFENYRACLRAVNSDEARRAFTESGFRCLLRDEERTPADTLRLAEAHFSDEGGPQA